MDLVPYRTLSFAVRSSPDRVAARLMINVAKPSFLPFERTSRPFTGRVTDSKFKIQFRNWNGSRVRAAVIVGSIKGTGTGTEVAITIRPHAFLTTFMALWFSGLLFFASVVNRSSGGQGTVALAIMALVVLPVVLAFNLEANKAERVFSDLFAKL